MVYLVDTDDRHARALTTILCRRDIAHQRFSTCLELLNAIDYEQIDEGRPGVMVITEVALPNLGGLDLLDVFRADRITIPTVLMGDGLTVAEAVNAMRAGALWVIEKPVSEADVVEAVATVSRAEQTPSRTAVARLARRRFESLTSRQRQLLFFVFQGQTNRQIAERLSISPRTVEWHRSAMMEKMRANTLSELIRTAATCIELVREDAADESA